MKQTVKITKGGRLVIATQRAKVDAAWAEAHPEARAAELVCLTVSDSGTGISPEKMPQIFEPFFTTKPDGLGMGLAISRTIIEAHGGKIWAENNPGRGATFNFTLPAQPGVA